MAAIPSLRNSTGAKSFGEWSILFSPEEKEWFHKEGVF